MANNLLKGKKGIIFGALNEQSIAWKVAERVVEEGASIVLTNTPVSIKFGTIQELAQKTGSIVVPAETFARASLTRNSITISTQRPWTCPRCRFTNFCRPSMTRTP